MTEKLKALGLCLGASTLSIVQLELDRRLDTNEAGNTKPRILDYSLYTHEGDPKRTLLDAFDRLNLESFDRIAATGRKFRKFVNLSSIPEPEAVEYALSLIHISEPTRPFTLSRMPSSA